MSNAVEGAGENKPVPIQGFDFDQWDLGANAERGAILELRNPVTGNKAGPKFHTVGADSATYRRNLRAIQDKAAMHPEREPTDSDTALLLGRARNAAAGMTGWEGVTVAGAAVEFSMDAAVELLTKYFWAADQTLDFINTRGNYLAA